MIDLTFDAPMPAGRSVPLGTLASLGLHGGLALAVILLSPIKDLVAPPAEPVAVEIVTEQQFAALKQPAETPPPVLAAPAPAEAAAPPAPGQPIASSGPLPGLSETPTLTATEFYSASILRQPDMQRIRRALTGFADSERMVQICNIEALEQIRRAALAFDPDTLVAYAMSDMMWQGMTLTADGGAFRSRREWYEVAFHCTVATGYEAVTAFDFKIGAAIPERDWEGHSLNAEDAEAD